MVRSRLYTLLSPYYSYTIPSRLNCHPVTRPYGSGDAPTGRSGTFVCDLVPDLVHAPKWNYRDGQHAAQLYVQRETVSLSLKLSISLKRAPAFR